MTDKKSFPTSDCHNDLKIKCLSCDKNINLYEIRICAMDIIDFINSYQENTISAESEKIIQLGISYRIKSRDQVIINLIKARVETVVSCL